MADDTIFALATGTGRAAVAIIRISGPHAASALRAMTGLLPAPRQAALVSIRDPQTDLVLDRGLVLWFPAPYSFTGEDCAELQLHGSRAVVAAALRSLSALAGCRVAEPGEFTRRAFLNGKLDLAAVEGLADLIDADTEAQRRQALRQLDGALGRWVENARERLLECLAWTEAAIDFADEGDIGDSALKMAVEEIERLASSIKLENGAHAGERVRDGFVVTIAGPPNAGKSTLLNALARREAAIVSPHAGTTRDPIEVDLDLGGYAVLLIDTAGIRDTVDPVEQEGVARAKARAASADLVLWLQPASERPEPLTAGFTRLWTVGTKADLVAGPPTEFDVTLSAPTGLGLDTLVDRLTALVATELAGGESALVVRLRHRHALEEAAKALDRATCADDAELVAEELRAANTALGRITGRIDVEDILGAIFSRFCIGK